MYGRGPAKIEVRNRSVRYLYVVDKINQFFLAARGKGKGNLYTALNLLLCLVIVKMKVVFGLIRGICNRLYLNIIYLNLQL